VTFDKDPLPVEDIDLAIGYFRMYQQRQALPLHLLDDRVELVDVGHA
jgi:hypothetical protein